MFFRLSIVTILVCKIYMIRVFSPKIKFRRSVKFYRRVINSQWCSHQFGWWELTVKREVGTVWLKAIWHGCRQSTQTSCYLQLDEGRNLWDDVAKGKTFWSVKGISTRTHTLKPWRAYGTSGGTTYKSRTSTSRRRVSRSTLCWIFWLKKKKNHDLYSTFSQWRVLYANEQYVIIKPNADQ